jgi:hypothetical protein
MSAQNPTAPLNGLGELGMSSALSGNLLDNSPLQGLSSALNSPVGAATVPSLNSSSSAVFAVNFSILPLLTSSNVAAQSISQANINGLVVNPPSIDSLTGLSNPLISSGNSPSTVSSAFITPSATSIIVATPNFSIMAGGKVTVNGSSDFDGAPLDLNDDALIYAAQGFTMNGSITLPVQRNTNGTNVQDSSGRSVLVNNAITVGPNYTSSSISGNNRYAGLNPPPILSGITIDVPSFAVLKQQELTSRIPAGTPTVIFNTAQNVVTTAAQWNQKFPPGGTISQPKIIQVTGGSLTIPTGVSISNTVIIVDNGNLTFSGATHTLNNVTLVANQGSVILANAQAKDTSILASGSVSMNGAARFEGKTLLANGTGDMTFNGATKQVDSTQNLTVVSQGNLTYNGAQNTRGTFLATGNFTFNGSTQLSGRIKAKGDVLFNGSSTIIGIGGFITDTIPPVITASLNRDTAPNNATNIDRLTSDSTIKGSVVDAGQIVEFKAGLNGISTGNYVDILSQRQFDGTFTLNRNKLEQINGGTLPDGIYTLNLLAKDQSGNTSTFQYIFTLDTTVSAPSNLDLIASNDSGRSSTDNITKISTPIISGKADVGSVVQLFSGTQIVGQAISDNSGNWQLTTSTLTNGTLNLTAKATDAAGNVSLASSPLIVTIDSVQPSLNLTSSMTAALTNSARLTGSINDTGSGVSAVSYRFDSGRDIPISLGTSGLFNQPFDFTGIANGPHSLSILATDIAGNQFTQSFNINVALDITAPTIAARLVQDTGISATDRITNNSAISGFVTDNSPVTVLRARFQGSTAWTNISGKITASGGFTLSVAELTQLNSGTLTDGSYTLEFEAADSFGNISEILKTTWVLDTALLLSVNLASSSDTNPLGDNATTATIVTLVGQTDSGSKVTLQQTNQVAIADDLGQFSFSNLTLALGNNDFTITATDVAGNLRSSSLNIQRLGSNNAPTNILLSNNLVAENSPAGTVIGNLSSIDPDTSDTHVYTLVNDAGGKFRLVNNRLEVAANAMLDFETQSTYSIRVRTIDSGSPSKFFEKTFGILLANVNEMPAFTSIPVNQAEIGTAYTYLINTSDPENSSRSITSTDLPSWLKLIDNGDGTAKLSGTPTLLNLNELNRTITLTLTDSEGLKVTQSFALNIDLVIREGNRFNSSQTLTFTAVDRPTVLSFTIDPIFDVIDTNFINDAFEVALIDPQGKPLTYTIAPNRDSFFNLTEGEPVGLASGVSYDAIFRRVSINLTGIKAGEAKLVFRLVNDDVDTATQVKVRDISLVDAPTTTLAPLQTSFGISTAINPITAFEFNELSNISSSIKIEYQQTSFNLNSSTLYTDISLKSIASYRINTPLIAVVKINDPRVSVRNADGYTPEGLPYYNYSSLIFDGKLDLNEKSIRSVAFYNPNKIQFDYHIEVLAQLNHSPFITSTPNIEVLACQGDKV